MRKPKIGLLHLTCPTHRESQNETGDDWVQDDDISLVTGTLKKNGMDVVEYGKVVGFFYELAEAEELFTREDVDLIFLNIATWNWADQVSQFARNMGKPLLVYTKVDSKAWSIGGLAATSGGFDELNLKNRSVYGKIDDTDVISKVISYAKASMVKNVLRRSRYGSIGGYGMGIITGIVDPNQWLRDFGILTGFTDQYALVVEAEKFPTDKVKDYYEKLKKEYKSIPEYGQVFENSIRLYFAMEKIIEEERYDFTGVKCTFELSDNYCSACLSQSRLAERGFFSACLNDANGALSGYILKLIKDNDDPVFTADVNVAIKEKNLIKLIDDGSASPKLAAEPKKEAELHFQPTIESKASGICTKLFAKPGDITLVRMARIDSKYVLHLTTGEVLDVKEKDRESIMEECGYPTWPHAMVRVNGNMDSFVSNLRSEYIHLAYGDYEDAIKDICDLYDIRLLLNE